MQIKSIGRAIGLKLDGKIGSVIINMIRSKTLKIFQQSLIHKEVI